MHTFVLSQMRMVPCRFCFLSQDTERYLPNSQRCCSLAEHIAQTSCGCLSLLLLLRMVKGIVNQLPIVSLRMRKKSTIQMVLLELKKFLDLQKVKVVIVDEHLKEIASIESCMEDASIQICKFHVLQALTREVRKTALAESERKLLISLCCKLVYA